VLSIIRFRICFWILWFSSPSRTKRESLQYSSASDKQLFDHPWTSTRTITTIFGTCVSMTMFILIPSAQEGEDAKSWLPSSLHQFLRPTLRLFVISYVATINYSEKSRVVPVWFHALDTGQTTSSKRSALKCFQASRLSRCHLSPESLEVVPMASSVHISPRFSPFHFSSLHKIESSLLPFYIIYTTILPSGC
jgi:hypothetical protein